MTCLNLEEFECDTCGWVELIEWPPVLKGKITSYRCEKCLGTMNKHKDGDICLDEKGIIDALEHGLHIKKL